MTKDENGAPMRVEILSRSRISSGFLHIEALELRHSLFAGGLSQVITREVRTNGDAAAVLLHDPAADQVVLIEQFRAGAIDSGQPWVLDIVAGYVEPGETPEAVVRREALEEAGARLQGELQKIRSYYTSVGGSTAVMHVYYGTVDATQLGGIHGLDEEHEDIRVAVVACAELFGLLDSDAVLPAALVAAGEWLRRKLSTGGG